MKQVEFARLLELFTVLVPHFNHVEANTVRSIWAAHDFGRNADARDLILLLRRNFTEHRTKDIGLIILASVVRASAERIRTSTNILVVLPKRRNRVAHAEIHSALNLVPQFMKHLERLSESCQLGNGLECINAPALFPWRMEIQCPRARRVR